MSANNYLSILHPVKSRYEVWMRDADTGAFMGKPRKAKTLEEALKIAQAWMGKEIIEYGIQEIDV